MATSRSRVNAAADRARGRTTRRGSARAASSSGPNIPIVVGGVAAALSVVLIIAMTSFGGDDKKGDSGADAQAATKEEPKAKQPAPKPKVSKPAITEQARPGKTPEIPPPAMPADLLQRADVHFEAVKSLWNEGARARKAGDTDTYSAKLKEAWAECGKLDALVEPYTDWLEHADLGEWAMSGEYVALSKQLGKWDKMTSRVQKLKTR